MGRSIGLRRFALVGAVVLLGGLIPGGPPHAVAAAAPTFTILDTNDFHGQLQASGSNPGLARVAAVVNGIRGEVGKDNVLLVDAGDEMQGSLLSNLQKGEPTIAAFNAMGEQVATFGNHEFDWGQTVLAARTGQASYPFVTANIVKNDTGSCTTAGWTKPDFASAPYVVETVGGVRVALVGVTTQETPTITIASATAGLCFKDPAESIEHYYAEMKGKADVIVVLSHLGFNDGGYGYGIPVYGDKTLAQKLNDAGDPVTLIVGGHSHTNMLALTPPGAVTVGGTTIVQAYYNGRQVGRADVTYAGGTATVSWQALVVSTTGVEDPDVKAVIDAAANNADYQALINKPIGYAQLDLLRNYNGDSMMADFVDDAIYRTLDTDSTKANDVDVFFNNAGGIRTDWCAKADSSAAGGWAWSSDPADCHSGTWTHAPMLLTYGQMFTILPFGNATVVGTMTGAQILEVLNQAATLNKGAIQVSGLQYKFYNYQKPDPKSTTTPPAMHTYAWGAYDACVVNSTGKCVPLDLKKTYRVGTNEFLAPAGGDNFLGFKYMKNLTYWGDMLDAVNSYVSKTYTQAHPYKGPAGNGKLDGRITQDGTAAGGSIVPITILHNNDSHGNLLAYEQLATLINQERAYNPQRTLLLSAGDQIQGDAMSYYFKTSYTGKASDGTPLPDSLRTDPIIAVMNALGYNAMTLGNHEFNFGSSVFKGVMGQAQFAVLGANVKDSGAYGLSAARDGSGVKPFLTKVVGPEKISVAIVGITNHRVPNYELPSNIPGLTFSNPLTAAQSLTTKLAPKNDAVVALTHIGFTTDPKSVDVDSNVDTAMAAQVSGLEAIVGGHSHTSPVTGSGDYKYLPTIIAGPGGEPVEVTQAYRYNQYLGEVILGMRPIVVGTIDDVSMMYGAGTITSKAVVTALTSRLNAIKSAFAKKQTASAISQLSAFASYVTAQRSAGAIRPAAASQLLTDATSMKTHAGGGYETVTEAGQYLAVTKDTPADPTIKAIVDPYVAALASYQDQVVGKTTAPIDTLNAFTEETNGANLQADASVFELAKSGITDVDVHLSGAMTNKKIADGATVDSPVTLKVSDMFAAMPYENSLVVLKMNGPQLKAVLERAYRNFYYYKYVDGYGGYSYYTTCMIDTNSVGKITYDEKTAAGQTVPPKPDGSNVVSLTIGGKAVDFSDATKYYNVSTVNYLAAGSCNFSDNGKSLWPLNQIVHDTQYYVRDAVIDYVKDKGTVSPAIEGRLVFENPPK